MGSRLGHDFVENFVWRLLVLRLLVQEKSNRKRYWESKDEVVGLGFDDGSHEWVCERPSKCVIESPLNGQSSDLALVESLHLDDFVFG